MLGECDPWVAKRILLATAMILLALGAPSLGLAAPAEKDCSGFTDAFELVKCRHDALAEQMEYTADTVFAADSKLGQRTHPARLKHIRDSRDKAVRAKKKNTPGRFKKLAKDEARGNGKAGHLVPLADQNGNGVCDPDLGEQCAAIELDASGQPQACNPAKKNKGKGSPGNGKFDGLECDVSYDEQEAETEEELAEMAESAEEMEKTYEAMENDFIEMNGHLDALNEDLPEGPVSVFLAANGCTLPELTPGLRTAAAVLRGLTAAAEGTASIVDSATGQTAVAVGFGGNARAAAVVTDAAAMVIEIAYITIDEILQDERSGVQDATADCVIKVAGDVAALQAELTAQHTQIRQNDDANTTMLMNRVEEVRAQLVKILNTPLGQRSEFPVK